jgi:formamidopyrimidine-DNA glycosylase
VPELPEVTALAEVLTARAAGLRIARVDVAAINALKTVDPPLSAALAASVLGFSRAGKHLVADLADADGLPLHLVVHLARGGWVRWREDPPRAPAGLGRRAGSRGSGADLALRILLVAQDAGQPPAAAIDVTEAGTQKRLAVHLVRDLADVPSVARLGPEPLADDFDDRLLAEILADAGRAQVKGVLRDQSRVAGIGNAYSDEILHAARISPFAPASGLDGSQRAALLESIRSTLGAAIAAARAVDPTTLKAEKRAGMAVHGRTGQPCPRCGDTIREVSFADSSLQYCPTCQTGGRVLADRRMSRLLR